MDYIYKGHRIEVMHFYNEAGLDCYEGFLDCDFFGTSRDGVELSQTLECVIDEILDHE